MASDENQASEGRMRSKTIGVTGPSGFVASHLIRTLRNQTELQVLPCPRETWADERKLTEFVAKCDSIVHLAGCNRGSEEEVFATNASLIEKLVMAAELVDTPLHIVFASSTQRERNQAYGRSKKHGEMQLSAWASSSTKRVATSLVVPNVYGPGCRPFYNSVVATFCYQLARGEEPHIDQDNLVEFIWVNDLVQRIIDSLADPQNGCIRVVGTAKLRISELLAKLKHFGESHAQHDTVPNISAPLDANLYATYLSYVDLEQHCHRPQVHSDNRGKLFEIIRMAGGGQVFFSTTKPGVIRGNHFHTRKIEWFCVLEGEAVIRLRKVDDAEVHEFCVSGSSPQFISIPVLHTHQIENVGERDLLTIFWCNEIFVPEDTDTYFQKVA